MSASENGHTGGYTPGPWRAVRGDELVFVEVVNIAHIGVSGGDANKAPFVVQAAPGSKGSLPHDALLIAAAPEMHEAGRKLANEVAGLKAFEHELRAVIGNTNWSVLMQRLAEAEAAISKATGAS